MMDLIKTCTQEVIKELGEGWSERVYHNALLSELRRKGLSYETEATTPVRYKGENVGFVRLDILVENRIIVELKKGTGGTKAKKTDVNQLIRYCTVLDKKGLLVYFQPPKCTFFTYPTDQKIK